MCVLCGGLFVFMCETGEKPQGNEGSVSTTLHTSRTSVLYQT